MNGANIVLKPYIGFMRRSCSEILVFKMHFDGLRAWIQLICIVESDVYLEEIGVGPEFVRRPLG